MKLKNKKINSKNIDDVFFVLNNSYNINNPLIKFIDNVFYKNSLLGKKVLFLFNENNKIIGMVIYKISEFREFNILTIEELCIINEFKSKGLSKILLEELLKIIKQKYNKCYLASIICDLRSISNVFDNYDIIYPTLQNDNLSNKYKIMVDTATNLLKKWYMKSLNHASILYIPFYKNKETNIFFESKNIVLNKNQRLMKKMLKKYNHTLGYGIGLLNLIKIC